MFLIFKLIFFIYNLFKTLKLEKGDPEWKAAKLALWTRHPIMRKWHIIVPGELFF